MLCCCNTAVPAGLNGLVTNLASDYTPGPLIGLLIRLNSFCGHGVLIIADKAQVGSVIRGDGH